MSKGKNVVVFGVPAYDIWKSGDGLALLNPGHFGFEGEYRTLDELMNSRYR